jgi:hypothetical protein
MESISSGGIDATWTYQYDDSGNKVSETQTSGTMGNSFTKYQYDSSHLLVQEDKTNKTIGKEERVNYKYNEIGQIIEKKTKHYYFNTTIILNHYYDEAGRLIKLFEKSSNGVSLTTIFEYDENGLPISDTWEGSISKTAYKTSYQINYE